MFIILPEVRSIIKILHKSRGRCFNTLNIRYAFVENKLLLSQHLYFAQLLSVVSYQNFCWKLTFNNFKNFRNIAINFPIYGLGAAIRRIALYIKYLCSFG